MAVSVVEVASNTATGDQTITGAGFTPKAVLVMCTAQTTDGIASGMSHTMGMATASGEQIGQAMAADDNVSPADTDRTFSTSNFINIYTPGSTTIDGVASFSSFNSDGCVINWSDAASSAWDLVFMFIGGDDVTDAEVGSFTLGGVGNQTVSGIGHNPTDVMFMYNDHGVSGAGFGLGIMRDDATDQQWAFGYAADTGETMASGYESGQSSATDECIKMLHVPMGGDSFAAAAVSFGTGQFVIDVTDTSTSRTIGYLSIEFGASGDSHVAVEAKSNSATDPNDQAVTGVGFTLEGLLTLQARRSFDGGETADEGFTIGFASGTGTTEQYIRGNHHASVIGSEANSGQKANRILGNVTGGASPTTWDYEGRLKTIASDGFTIEHSPVEATTDAFGYWAILGGTATGGIDQTPSEIVKLVETVSVTLTTAYIETPNEIVDLVETTITEVAAQRIAQESLQLIETITVQVTVALAVSAIEDLVLKETITATIDTLAYLTPEQLLLTDTLTETLDTPTDTLDQEPTEIALLKETLRRDATHFTYDGVQLKEQIEVQIIQLIVEVSQEILELRENTQKEQARRLHSGLSLSEEVSIETAFIRVLPDGVLLKEDVGLVRGANTLLVDTIELVETITIEVTGSLSTSPQDILLLTDTAAATTTFIHYPGTTPAFLTRRSYST